MRLFFATTNRGKLAELESLARTLDLEIASMLDAGGAPEQVPEVGDSFAANALLKAEAAARRVGGFALADDSGLCVDALSGAPGIHSARWSKEEDGSAGRRAEAARPEHSKEGDRGNNARLLRELEGVEPARRGAEYRCALALCDDRGERLLVEGACRGRIALAPRGSAGFGYDPLFEIPELDGRTFGELSPEIKAARSHRARAFAKLLPLLRLLAH